MQRLTVITILCFLAAVTSSCSKSSDSVGSGGGGSTLTGDLAGVVYLYDREGQYVAEASGVTVRCDGTDFSAETDTTGRWIIHGLPSRTYSLTFTKPGYTTRRIRSIVFLGGGVVNAGVIYLAVVPDFTITLDAVILPSPSEVDSFGRVTLHDGVLLGHTSPNGPFAISSPALLFVGKHAVFDPVDPDSYGFASGFSVDKYGATADTIRSLRAPLTYSSLLGNGFKSGDSIYARAYPRVIQMTEFDPVRSEDVYVGLGQPSNTLSGVLR
ncbi:MAG: carboxypeptidase regulatory-like domain-containing protein [Bacteroidetes bacterium]|nr:carboxypeptidase regulatory-like domain-containing protein [Bacteroidota bacterium]